MKGQATGRIDGEHVVVMDQVAADRLHKKGHVGQPMSGGGLQVSRVEAAHAIRSGRLQIDGTDWHELLVDHRAETQYLAYADLRERGLVVRHEGDGFAVWQRGQAPPEPAWFHAVTVSERDPVDLEDLASRDGDIVAIVDDDGAVTHYRIDQAHPTGTVAWPGGRHSGIVLDDRVIVPGAAQTAQGAGTPHGEDLILSITEATALHGQGWLDLDEDALQAAAERQQDFGRTMPVYQALREAGVLAKSGFRFGTHLRCYSGAVDAGHAEWLVQCHHRDDRPHWSHLSRAVRLAHGVRKKFLLAVHGPVAFTELAWFRP